MSECECGPRHAAKAWAPMLSRVVRGSVTEVSPTQWSKVSESIVARQVLRMVTEVRLLHLLVSVCV